MSPQTAAAKVPRPAPDKEFDLVLFGATGFTGRLVAEYLVKKAPAVRWALGGRSRSKLEAVRAELAAIDPKAGALPVVLGDSLDRAAMDALVRRTRVVATTVGPFARYGSALVAACAEHGVSYCDSTGEPPWIRQMIDEHHARAEASGARIVHCCGFDSIPSDLGVLMLHDHLSRRQRRLTSARFRVLRMKGGMSGGTAASLLEVLERASDPAVRRALADPYALDPQGSPRGLDGPDSLSPRRDPGSRRWSAPFVMAGINTRIVRRSNALLDYPYGRDFRYDEAIDTGAGAPGFARAAAVSAATASLALLASMPPMRPLLRGFLPAPGDGPSREAREKGSFRVELRATDDEGQPLTGTVADTLDPGYGSTAKMVAEAALCLAEDPLPARGGVLTPASSLGLHLVERLRAAGMTFQVS